MVNAVEKYRRNFLKYFEHLDDLPATNHLMFGFHKYGKQLAEYMTSKYIKTPLTVGLNGKWGSGKTTLLQITQNEINKINKDPDKQNDESYVHVKCISFNAWGAERAGVAYSLWRTISENYPDSNGWKYWHKTKVKAVGDLMLDIASRKMANISLEEAKIHLKKLDNAQSLSDKISKLTRNDRLVVFIDDLDRCDASNILDLLEIIKNVLIMDNILFFVTVDMNQIERAWELRYNPEGKIESKEYIEKLFPVVFSLPVKNDVEIAKYHESLVRLDEDYDQLRTYLIKSLSDNPRKIKRMLNVIFFLIKNYDLTDIDTNDVENGIKECKLHFALIITWVALTTSHKEISRILERKSSAIVPLALLFDKTDYFLTLKQRNLARIKSNRDASIRVTHNSIDHEFLPMLFLPHIDDILQIVTREDDLAFKTIKQVARFLDPYQTNTQHIQYTDDIYQKYGKVCEIMKKIIEYGGLCGPQ